MKINVIIIPVLAMALCSCNKQDTQLVRIQKPAGDVSIIFEHYQQDKPLVFDSLLYTTSLGYHYQVNDLQYFISDVVFHCAGGGDLTLAVNDGIHYTDARVKATTVWDAGNIQFPSSTINSISFIFGLDKKANYSGRFPDPPERDMFWPDILGGGYHYMKMNLKWKNNTMQENMPFMFHLGIGQIYAGTTHDPDSIMGFVQNYFHVTLPGSAFTIKQGTAISIRIRMHVERWFDGENAFDFSAYPMGIMQDQDGMHRAMLNGMKAFSCLIETEPVNYEY